MTHLFSQIESTGGFGDIRSEEISCSTRVLPTIGDAATSFFFGSSGLFLGGSLGLVAGCSPINGALRSNPDITAKLETADRRLRIDLLKREIDAIEEEERCVILSNFFQGPLPSP